MPTYVRVAGFRAEPVRFSEDADLLRHLLDRDADHTDATLVAQLSALIAGELPGVRVEVVTVDVDQPSHGSVLEITEDGHRARAVPWADGPTDPQVQAILAFSFGPLTPRSDLYATLMSGSPKRASAALSRAATLCRGGRLQAEQKRERRDTVAALVRVLRDLPLAAPLRAEIWGALSSCDEPPVHALALECMKAGDPALTDGHIERQRTFVMDALPTHVGNALSEGLEAPWVRRGQEILGRWKIEPTGDAARMLRARTELTAALQALEGLRGRELASVRDVLQAQLAVLKRLAG